MARHDFDSFDQQLQRGTAAVAGLARQVEGLGRSLGSASDAFAKAEERVGSLDFGAGGGGTPARSSTAEFKGGSPGNDVLPSAVLAAGTIEAALTKALMPLQQIGTYMARGMAVANENFNKFAATVTGKIQLLVRGADDFWMALENLHGPLLTDEQDMQRILRTITSWGHNFDAVANGKGLKSFKAEKFAAPVAGASRLNREFRTIGPAVQKATGSIKRMGAEIALAVGAFALTYKVAQGLAGGFKAGLAGAVALNETVSKSEAVFGKAGASFVANADDMARKFGIVKGEFMEGAMGIGQMAQAAGKADAEAAALGNTFAKLAADLSSQDNIPFAEAIDKLRSGLAGESEPLRRFGVLIDEDTVKAYAYANGIAKVGEKLGQSQKVTARAALIQQQLARVTGDLANTADQPARGWAKFTGTLTNNATAIGTIFLPAIREGIALLNMFAEGAASAFESSKGYVESFAAAVVSGFQTIGVVYRNFSDILEIAQLKVGEWGENFVRWLGVIPINLAQFADYIANNWRQIITDGVNAVSSVFHNLGTNLGELFVAIQEWFKDPTGGFQFEWTPLLDGFKATAEKLPALIRPDLYSVQAEIDAVGRRIAAKEAARVGPGAKVAAPARVPLPELGDKDKEKKGDKQEGNAAAMFGSEAASNAIAKFYNSGSDDLVKESRRQTTLQERIAAAVEKFNAQVRADNPKLYPVGGAS